VPHSVNAAPFPLAQAPIGVGLMVADVLVDGADTVRLQALGLCRGRRVELVKGGDPLIVRVMGSRVGLAGKLAAKVMVNRTQGSSRPPQDIPSRVA
jgi:Fe2+ transport system protein FeoA